MSTLDYHTPHRQTPRRRRVLVLVAIPLPIVLLSFFFIGTILLEDYLVNGDGRSWYRASLYVGLPCAAVLLIVLCALIATVLSKARPRPPGIVAALLLNGGTLCLIAYGIRAAAGIRL